MGGGRADAGEYARRVNAAVELLASGVPVVEAVRVLVGRFGCSTRQKMVETIASQTAALRAHAEQLGLDVPEEWVFEDEGHSGATLVRPALERLRDLVAGVGIDVV